jgi:putative transposase
MDFVADRLADGRECRPLKVLNDFLREGLGIDVDISLPAERVVRSFNLTIERRSEPLAIRVDNGLEYVSCTSITRSEKQGIALTFIRPGKPRQNAHAERFTKTARHEWLDLSIFENVAEMQ